MRRVWLAVLLVLFAGPVFAQIEKPKSIEPYIHSDTPYGYGTLRKLMLNVYDSSLWTDQKQWSMNGVFALSITYNMNFSTEELVDRSIEEMRHIGDVSDEKVGAYKEALSKVFPNVKSGSTITALYLPKKALNFYYNDRLTGSITDMELASHFILIWLSPKTSEPELRAALLGKGGA